MALVWDNLVGRPRRGETEDDRVRRVMAAGRARSRHRTLVTKARNANPDALHAKAEDLQVALDRGGEWDDPSWADAVSSLAGMVMREADKLRARHQLADLEKHAIAQGWARRDA